MPQFSHAPCMRYADRPEWVPTEYLDHVDNVDNVDQYTTTEMLGMLQGDLSGAMITHVWNDDFDDAHRRLNDKPGSTRSARMRCTGLSVTE